MHVVSPYRMLRHDRYLPYASGSISNIASTCSSWTNIRTWRFRIETRVLISFGSELVSFGMWTRRQTQSCVYQRIYTYTSSIVQMRNRHGAHGSANFKTDSKRTAKFVWKRNFLHCFSPLRPSRMLTTLKISLISSI